MRDLGLSYEQAAHGIQTAIKYELENCREHIMSSRTDKDKHLRVGIDLRAADASGLAKLLIDKGVFTADEYVEYMRLAANEELARYTDYIRKQFKLPIDVDFL